jgi:hypothetical protein
MGTDATFGLLILLLILAFACWQTRVDEKNHGKPKTADYLWALMFGCLWFTVFMAVFSLSPIAYAVVIFAVYCFFQVVSPGDGKRGLWRQIKDGCFLAGIISVPICFVLWGTSK